MSNTLPSTIFAALKFSLLLTGESHDFTKRIPRKSLGLEKEKLSHIHFYLHDIVSGRNPTSVLVASAPKTNTSAAPFGEILVMDDALNVGPEPSSEQVGRAQGIYAIDSLGEPALLMAFSCVFTEGKYNGSTISILGRNAVFSDVREMPVDDGVFRFARGYAEARTHAFDLNSGNAILYIC
ncbi:hypothetical protein DCAR_0417348 [Daucus carota subsp. sativus]|uniref:Dirigent protein n=1 Tax=Daucus carota subsp. sativus TaxID=79200 RepID=A0AAF0WY71_DAUCS|nr:hypothetical protein DCAR_0417348 [Daucus carota subsp. sativus]